MESKNQLLSFLRANYVMSIATSDNDMPSSSILLYHVDEGLNFYFATHTNSLKVRNLQKNPRISLSVWEHNKMLVQANGKAIELTSDEEKVLIIDKLAESAAKGANFWPPLFRIKGDDYIVFKITPDWMRVLDLEKDTMTQVDSPFTEVMLDKHE